MYFFGTRIKRDLYKNSKGLLINADINGTLNILKKSNVVDVIVPRSRRQVDNLLRIRIA